MFVAAGAVDGLAQVDEAVAIPMRQRLEQHAANDAEDRGVGADAEPEREHDGEREAAGAGEAAEGVAKIGERAWEFSLVLGPRLITRSDLGALAGGTVPGLAPLIRRISNAEIDIGPKNFSYLEPAAISDRPESLAAIGMAAGSGLFRGEDSRNEGRNWQVTVEFPARLAGITAASRLLRRDFPA